MRAAVVGQELPRYLIYGKTCAEVGLLESSAGSGQVGAAARAGCSVHWTFARAGRCNRQESLFNTDSCCVSNVLLSLSALDGTLVDEKLDSCSVRCM